MNDEDAPLPGVDKTATPAKRLTSEADLAKHMDRARPLVLTTQRDSDANRNVESSRVGAFGKFSQLEQQSPSSILHVLSTESLFSHSSLECWRS